jgi:Tetratricopeptide repeat
MNRTDRRLVLVLALAAGVGTVAAAPAPAAPPPPGGAERAAADSLLRAGNWAGAAAAYERADALSPLPPLARYNLGCVYARLGRTDDALAALETVAVTGIVDAGQLGSDPDLASLRGDPRFEALREKADAKAHPCAHDPRYRRFDFWIGSWDVFVGSGAKGGTSRVDRLLDGCALLENWQSRFGSGKSINAFDARDGKWTQTWVSARGEVTHYEEIDPPAEPGALRFLARIPDAASGETLRRMTFTPVSPDTVIQHIETSADGGTTWTVAFHGIYVRRSGE